MRLFVFLSLFSILTSVHAQLETKYVAAKNGLIVRDAPGIDGSRTGVLEFNEEVIIKEKFQLDTINYRIARWVFVECQSTAKSGYVYSGYLNHCKIIDEYYYSLLNYLPRIVDSLETMYDIKREVNSGLKEAYAVRIRGSLDFIEIDEYGWEWGRTELFLYDWTLYEVINLIEAAEFYFDRKEIELFEEAIIPGRLDRFEWRVGYDGIDQLVIVEKANPKGIRIYTEGAL